MLWVIDMTCIVVSYLIASWLRYNDKRDYGDKTLHYMVCVVFLLFCVIYTFLADWNRDFIKRGYFKEFVSGYIISPFYFVFKTGQVVFL